MAGPASIQASSAAYYTIPNQYATAFLSGWALDQKLDPASATGGFLTNCSPSSSGMHFVSTGDATAFYLIGRVIQAVQAGGTVVATVGQSSFAAGVTSVYLNQVSTAASLSTAMSTGALTSVAASPLITGASGDSPGGSYLIATTGAAPFFSPYLAVSSSTASAPSTNGAVRLPNNDAIYARNAAGNNSYALMYLDTNNVIQLGTAAAAGGVQTATAYYAVGANPATVGAIRVPSSTANVLVQRNAANTADEQLLPLQSASTALAADIAFSTGAANTFTDGPALPLWPGTWFIDGAVVVQVPVSVTVGVTAKLWDGTSVESIAEINPTTGVGNNTPTYTIPLKGLVTLASSATWKISAAQTVGGTTTYLLKATPFDNGGGNNKASYIKAIRIGQ